MPTECREYGWHVTFDALPGAAGRRTAEIPRQPGPDLPDRPGGRGPGPALPVAGDRTSPVGRANLDDTEFCDYVASRKHALLHSAYLLTGNRADAEDLVQAALAKTYQAWHRIEDRRALDGYVRRAIVNTHISWWRRRRVDEYPTDAIPDLPVADPAVDADESDCVHRAVARLPQRMRAAVVLRFFADLTEAEVAAILGVSQGTVKSTVSRAVAKLRADADLARD